jgi:hypothetical protein
MEMLNVEQLQAGMVVASPVSNASGAVLCPMGFKLTDSAITRFKNAGVDTVLVEDVKRQGFSLEDRMALLEARFQGIDDPVLVQIHAIVERFVRKSDI